MLNKSTILRPIVRDEVLPNPIFEILPVRDEEARTVSALKSLQISRALSLSRGVLARENTSNYHIMLPRGNNGGARTQPRNNDWTIVQRGGIVPLTSDRDIIWLASIRKKKKETRGGAFNGIQRRASER